MGHNKITRTQQQVGKMQHASISIQSLPIPDPAALERLEIISPGITQQFMDMAKNEQKHRQEIDHKNQRRSLYSLRYAFGALVIICILCGIGFFLGFPIQAATIACTIVIGSILAFLGVKNAQSTPKAQ